MLIIELVGVFRENYVDLWVERLNDAGVPCAPIYNMKYVFEDLHF